MRDTQALSFVAVVAILVSCQVGCEKDRRELTQEATQSLRQLHYFSVSYYEAEYVTATGELLPAQFPESIAMTPSTVPCGEEADLRRADWAQPTWQALNFTPPDPHRYAYQYDSSGVGEEATFTVTAFGDLDCNGVLSTFVRIGDVQSGEVRGGVGLLVSNELE
jgi:hypothetical protein